MLCRYLGDKAKEKGISEVELSQITGFTENNISRMLSGKYSPSLDNFLRLAEAVGVYFFMIEKDADEGLVETMKNRWRQNEDN